MLSQRDEIWCAVSCERAGANTSPVLLLSQRPGLLYSCENIHLLCSNWPPKKLTISPECIFFFFLMNIRLQITKKIVGEDSGYESMWEDKEDSENDDGVNAPLSSSSYLKVYPQLTRGGTSLLPPLQASDPPQTEATGWVFEMWASDSDSE